MNKENQGLIIATAVLSATLIFVSYQIKIPYKQQIPSQMGITNTISVNGEGKISTSPDTFVINANVSETAKTTKEAQTMMKNKIIKIQEILKNNDIKKENIKTTSITVYPDYDRSNNQRKLLGYKAEQALEIEVGGKEFAEKGSNIIAQLGDAGNININNTYFVLKNKDEIVKQSRAKAFENAKNKAEQLAQLSNLTLGKATMITDSEVSNYPSPYPMYAKAEMADGVGGGSANNISPGQTEVIVNLQIIFELK